VAIGDEVRKDNSNRIQGIQLSNVKIPPDLPILDLTRKYRNAGVYIVRSKQKLYAAGWGEAVNPGPHFE
jgi:hypothetical protein